jgi:hypothetical protein
VITPLGSEGGSHETVMEEDELTTDLMADGLPGTEQKEKQIQDIEV